MNLMLLLAQVAPALADSIAGANPVLTPVAAPDEMNLWSMAVKGGWIMVVLGVLSVVCFYILFERNYVIRKAGKEDPMFMERIKDYIHSGEIKAAIQAPDSVQIRSGYSANAEIVLERALKTLALPEITVEFSGDSTFVYVLTDSVPQQKFKRQQIEVGMSDGIKIAVKSGLTAKDKVRGAEKKDK